MDDGIQKPHSLTPLMWTDSHSHLASLNDADLDSVLSTAVAAGVSAIVNTATDLQSCSTVIEQAAGRKMLAAAIGISPFDTRDLPDNWQTEIHSLAARHRVVAIGEIGLDSTNPTYPDSTVQIPVFEQLLDIAVSLDLPVVVHSRGNEQRVSEICYAHGVRKALFHCFTGTQASLCSILENGYYVSFSGIITFKSAPLMDVVIDTPLDRLLIETDSPYLAPVPHRGKPNQPAWVTLVGRRIAEIRKIPVETVQYATADNFKTFFGF